MTVLSVDSLGITAAGTTVHGFVIRMVMILRQSIVQCCTWYNHSIRIRYIRYRHTGTCIL